MNGDRIVTLIGISLMMYLVVHGLSARRLGRGKAIRMALLWLGLFGLVILLFWILAHYGMFNLT